jgi:hypothetical protein
VGVTGEGERFGVEGRAYRRDLLAAMRRSTIERGGQRIIPLFPQTHALLKASNYTALDYYGLQAGQMLERGLLDPNGPEARAFVDMLEKRGGLTLGACRFAGGIDHAYTFGYWLNCLQRGEAKKVLLGFYTSLAYGMTRDTYSGVEVTFLRSGDNYPTLPHLYSGTQQLALLRAMLCLEEGDGDDGGLLLCGAVPRPWLADVKRIAARGFATRFGNVSFVVESHVAAGSASVSIDPPTRHPPSTIRLRLRHPDGKTIASAKVTEGRAEASVDGDDLVLRKLAGAVKVDVRFE